MVGVFVAIVGLRAAAELHLLSGLCRAMSPIQTDRLFQIKLEVLLNPSRIP